MSQNVLLLVLDSARKDYYDEVAHTHQLADVRYENARAASCWSVPSHPSMFTGLLPSEHGVHARNINLDISDHKNICDQWEGRTVGVSSNVYASSSFGFDGIFDEFVDVPRYQPFINALDATDYFRNSGKDGMSLYTGFIAEAARSPSPIRSLMNGLAAQAKKSLMETRIPDPIDDGATAALNYLRREVRNADEPIFGFANLMEPHEPYSFFRGMERDLVDETSWSSLNIGRWDLIYHGEEMQRDADLIRQYHRATIEYTTRKIAALADELPDTTIIVTSDHGENLGFPEEDGLWQHTSSLSEALTHVPLDIINAPDGVGEVESLVSHLDLPQIVDALSDGDLPRVTRTAAAAETVGMSEGPKPPKNESYWDRAIRAVWRNGEKMTWDSHSPEAPEWATDEFQVPIEDLPTESNSNSVDIDEATEARLEGLGYM